MTLREQRVLFTLQVARLIVKAHDLGYECALDQVKRTQAEADANARSGKGIRKSLHVQGLACDLLLYKNGVYLTDSAAYAELGHWWERLHPLNAWGGRFAKPDGNHFSSSRDGVR